MPDSTPEPPTVVVQPHELPASLRDAGLDNWIREPLDDAVDRRRRIVMPPAAAAMGTPLNDYHVPLLNESRHDDTIFMMGDNPDLPVMPKQPTLRNFFELRLSKIGQSHMLQSARLAVLHGLDEKVVLACLLHDIAVAGLLSANHGYWAAQMIRPYVAEEVAWAVEKHEPLRYFADESVGYTYPEAYVRFFGPDYDPPEFIKAEHEAARKHRWYMTSRLVTINDVYSFDPDVVVSFDDFEDLVGRNFRQPAEGLGFDGSPVAHMWRTMIWPNNFL
jgi:hypothetical protein